jgi:hypothetical protein
MKTRASEMRGCLYPEIWGRRLRPIEVSLHHRRVEAFRRTYDVALEHNTEQKDRQTDGWTCP